MNLELVPDGILKNVDGGFAHQILSVYRHSPVQVTAHATDQDDLRCLDNGNAGGFEAEVHRAQSLLRNWRMALRDPRVAVQDPARQPVALGKHLQRVRLPVEVILECSGSR